MLQWCWFRQAKQKLEKREMPRKFLQQHVVFLYYQEHHPCRQEAQYSGKNDLKKSLKHIIALQPDGFVKGSERTGYLRAYTSHQL